MRAKTVSDVADTDAIVAKTLAKQRERLEMLGIFSAIAIVITSAWYLWPGIEGRTDFLSRLGPGLILMLLALAMQDFVDYGPKQRSNLGTLASISWPGLIVLGIRAINQTTLGESFGFALLLVCGGVCYQFSSHVLTGSLKAVRYRGLVQLVGASTATAILLSYPVEGQVMNISLVICLAAFGIALFDAFGKDPDRSVRNEFKKIRNQIEGRILQLRADGIQVDQAASLLQNATEAGYTDPKEGIILLRLAEDDIERTLAMSSDITDIRADAEAAVNEADDIAPTAKKALRLLTQGDREMELGSLRDAEMLYRKAKKHAGEIIEFWGQAEEAISAAKRALSGCQGEQYQPLFRAIEEAQAALNRETPAEAVGLALAVPEHVENLGKTEGEAEEILTEAKRAVDAASGIDDSDFQERLAQAEAALKEGNYSLARGTADSVLREVARESEAMTEVQRAWRQRKKLASRWKEWADAKEWDARLVEVDKARKGKQWSHASMLLGKITSELDAESAASAEAKELLDFVQSEWRVLRDKLEANGIKVDDVGRQDCESAIGESVDAFSKGDIDTCLKMLGEADQKMENLRRRV